MTKYAKLKRKMAAGGWIWVRLSRAVEIGGARTWHSGQEYGGGCKNLSRACKNWLMLDPGTEGQGRGDGP